MIDDEFDGIPRVEAATLDDAGMHEQIAEFLFGRDDAEQRALGTLDHAAVANLATRFTVERCLIEDEMAFIAGLESFGFLAAFDERADDTFGGFGIVAQKVGRARAFAHFKPDRFGGGIARTFPGGARFLLLLVHRGCESRLVDADVAGAKCVLRQIEREAEGVVELEGNIAGKDRASFEPAGCFVEQLEAVFKRLAELGFLKLQRFGDERFAPRQLGVGITHLAHESWHQTMHQRRLGAQQMGVAHGAAHDPAEHVAAAFV